VPGLGSGKDVESSRRSKASGAVRWSEKSRRVVRNEGGTRSIILKVYLVSSQVHY
jgi:hypothetical protein